MIKVRRCCIDMLVGREHLNQKIDRWFDLIVERDQGKIKKAHYE